MRFAVLSLLTILAVGAALPSAAQRALPQRTVSITIDDLPYVGGGTLEEATISTDSLLAALSRNNATADGFVTGSRVEREGETEVRRRLLWDWLWGGHALQNHSYSHLRFSDTDTDAYLADVARGHSVVTGVLDGALDHNRVAYFRPPFNDLGASDTTRAALAASLASRGVRLAPFTVEHGDYIYDALFRAALADGDSARAREIGDAYLDHLDVAFGFAEELSVDTFGREIPQVFLIHANRVNAEYLDAMLARLAARGYTFVALYQAMEDPAYDSPDAYLRKWGVSWLHRWRVARDLPNRLRDEPEVPAWIWEAYQAL